MRRTKKVLCLLLALAVIAGISLPTAATADAATALGCIRQNESKWRNYYYGSGNLYDTGCGIFSLVNAVGYLTGKRMDVTAVASWAHSIRAYNVTGAEGSYRTVLYPRVQAKYGATYGFKVDCGSGSGYWSGSSSTKLKNHLQNGGVAVGHVPGHFIALVGYNASTNKFHVYDSYPTNSRGTKSNGGDVWVTQSHLATGKLKLDWFCLLTATGKPASTGGSGSSGGSTGTPSEPAANYKVGVYKTTTDLNMRSNNNADASLVATLPQGTSVNVTDVKSGWGYLSYNGKYGWINLKYATRTGDLPPTYTTGVYDTTTDLNMRSAGNANASLVTTLPSGTTVFVTSVTADGWGYTSYSGKNGYINLKYAKRTGNLPDTAGFTTGIYTLTTDLNMRGVSDASGALVTTLPKGASLSVTTVSSGWGYTKYLGYSGWINLKYASRTGNLGMAKSRVLSADVYQEGYDYTVSWEAMPGAESYNVYVLALYGEPDPGSSSEAGFSLFSGNTGLTTRVTIPAAKLRGVRYVKVAIETRYPQGSAWVNDYIECSKLPFTDVPVSSDYYEALVHGYQNGYFSGTAASTFNPQANATRANVAQVLYAMVGTPGVSGTLPFTDVPSGAYYRNGVMWCYQNGVTSGITATTFGPNNVVTTQQMAMFLYMLAKNQKLDTGLSANIKGYSDYCSVASYAQQAMAWAVAAGIVTPKDGALRPTATLTRGELAKAVYAFDTYFRP